jgi:hypothetical protein
MPNIAELVSKYLFGAVCVCAGLLVLASQYLFPGAVNPQIYPVGYVLLMMGAIAFFPQQYMRLVNPGLGSLTGDLVTHLNKIGVKATEIKPDSAEAIKKSAKVFSNDPLDVPPWGVIKVEGRNVEFVEPVVMNVPGGGGGAGKNRRDAMNVTMSYLLRAMIGDEGDFSATSQTGWEGGSLAEALNTDDELKRMLEGLGRPRIRVRGHKADSYVSISQLERGSLSGGSMVKTFGLRDFPSAEEFAVYDRIAGHVKSVQASENISPLSA